MRVNEKMKYLKKKTINHITVMFCIPYLNLEFRHNITEYC